MRALIPLGEDAREEAAGNKALSLSCSDAFVPKGSFVVVEGPSGSGKSTLFKLALGAYDADGFTYELEEGASCAASQVPAGSFAYVPQDNFLFAGTVRENVAFAAPDANDDQVRRACEAACAWDFVKELPQGIKANIAVLPEKKTVFVAAHRAKAREFVTMRLRVVWRGWAW